MRESAVVFAAVAAALVLVEKGNFSDTLLDKGEKAGDDEVIGEMEGPSLVAAMTTAIVVEGGGELRVTLLGEGSEESENVAEEWWRTAKRRGYLVVVGLFRQRRKKKEGRMAFGWWFRVGVEME
ncbi:hypothetical protein K7X08_020690 [Anisodus acutangulus]|uniref:Uncharacterized protein n=1 Tax=Anisodus acutangulus TaxID=402998 RepID=A0A9Q1MTB3_9SOLA|nr:hypothetical protein K7X08_020690 [Anisodus acutangulus]